MQTNSLVNGLYNRMSLGAPKPVVGMGATMTGWTDRYPGTVTKVTEFGGSKRYLYEVEVQGDEYKVVKGSAYDGSAEYEFKADPKGQVSVFVFLKKDQKWAEMYRNPETGRINVCKSGKGLILGFRERYYDPSF